MSRVGSRIVRWINHGGNPRGGELEARPTSSAVVACSAAVSEAKRRRRHPDGKGDFFNDLPRFSSKTVQVSKRSMRAATDTRG